MKTDTAVQPQHTPTPELNYKIYATAMKVAGFEPVTFKEWQAFVEQDNQLKKVWQEVDQNAG